MDISLQSDITSINDWAFANDTIVSTISIQSNVTKIGESFLWMHKSSNYTFCWNI
ncbi:MAG: leucine-rich repeat domain-containing protein [Clostridia bacterium]|nr:leucine-rich repeat domain-containing protein [Clostridia bacterium]